jgi:hypothetical protein
MPRTTCLSGRARTRLTVVAVLACATAGSGLVGLGSASAATVHKSSTRTFTLPAHTTKTFDVGYPSAQIQQRQVLVHGQGVRAGSTVCDDRGSWLGARRLGLPCEGLQRRGAPEHRDHGQPAGHGNHHPPTRT